MTRDMTRRRFLEGAVAWALAPVLTDALAARCGGGDRLAVIPPGPFWMGSDERERAYAYRIGGDAAKRNRWFDTELPRRRVTLGRYAIDRYLVTNEDYQPFVQETGHRAPFITEEEYQHQGYLVHPYAEVRPYLWRDQRPPEGRGKNPVVLVGLDDAVAYAYWRSEKEGRRVRLPTEAEWEKAARGTDGRYFPWGNRWRSEFANAEYRVGGTTDVGSYPRGASPYGCLDMAGNVFEWTATEFADGQAVMKGGSWDDQPGICRTAARHGRLKDARHILIGFRCVCEVPGVTIR